MIFNLTYFKLVINLLITSKVLTRSSHFDNFIKTFWAIRDERQGAGLGTEARIIGGWNELEFGWTIFSL